MSNIKGEYKEEDNLPIYFQLIENLGKLLYHSNNAIFKELDKLNNCNDNYSEEMKNHICKKLNEYMHTKDKNIEAINLINKKINNIITSKSKANK